MKVNETKAKSFQKYEKRQGQSHKVKDYYTQKATKDNSSDFKVKG